MKRGNFALNGENLRGNEYFSFRDKMNGRMKTNLLSLSLSTRNLLKNRGFERTGKFEKRYRYISRENEFSQLYEHKYFIIYVKCERKVRRRIIPPFSDSRE